MFSGLLCPRYAESYRGTIYVCQPDPAFRPDRPAAVALRDVVVFPHMVIPLFVGRPRSIRALEVAMEAGKSIMLVAQKSAGKDDPTPEDVYEIGCVAGILQMLKLPDGTVKVLVEGTQRARINTIEDADSHFTCQVTRSSRMPSRVPRPRRCAARSLRSSSSTSNSTRRFRPRS